MTKTMSEGVRTFSTIENPILRTLSNWASPSPPRLVGIFCNILLYMCCCLKGLRFENLAPSCKLQPANLLTRDGLGTGPKGLVSITRI